MVSDSKNLEITTAVTQWLSRAAYAVSVDGLDTIHLDDLVSLEEDLDRVEAGLAALRALVELSGRLARDNRIMLSLLLEDVPEVVPLTQLREAQLWSSLDPDVPPSIAIVDLRRESILYDEERYTHPMRVETPVVPDGRIVCYYVASRPGVYRDEGRNFNAAIVFEYYPSIRTSLR